MNVLKRICFICIIAGAAFAEQGNPLSLRYEKQGVHILITSCNEFELFIDLRDIEDYRILDSVYSRSRYMPPRFEIKDLTGDGLDEILVFTRGGGTGIAVTSLSIFTVAEDRLVEAGQFVLDGEQTSFMQCQMVLPDGPEDVPLQKGLMRGELRFLEDGRLLYSYAETERDGADLKFDFKVEEYQFNADTFKFEPCDSTNSLQL